MKKSGTFSGKSTGDFRRRGIIHNIEVATGLSGAALMDHLQLEMAPTVIADECVTMADCDTEDLRAAMRKTCGH